MQQSRTVTQEISNEKREKQKKGKLKKKGLIQKSRIQLRLI